MAKRTAPDIPSPYSMALAEALGLRMYGVLHQISQAEVDIFYHQGVPEKESNKEEKTSDEAAAVIKEDDQEERENEEREEMYEVAEKLHEQVMRKNSKSKKTSYPSSRKIILRHRN
ncbi:hypothetical protein ABFS82_08G216200 [Erythranthe guttata]